MQKEAKLDKKYLRATVANALAEDIKTGDITAKLIPKSKKTSGYILCRENAVICGTSFVDEVFRQLDPKIKIDWLVRDKDEVCPNQILCFLTGSARALLSGERTALNFLQTLSATATTTRQYIKVLKKPAKTKITTALLDTRKTIPGLRLAQKYAVTCGGGQNHRMGLYDGFLIKENHIAIMGSSVNLIRMAKSKYPKKFIEVEVRNLEELKEALKAKAQHIMLDNFDIATIKKAVKINAGRAKLEASGGIKLSNLKKIAATGVDFISVGSLTKDIKAIDLSMIIEPLLLLSFPSLDSDLPSSR